MRRWGSSRDSSTTSCCSSSGRCGGGFLADQVAARLPDPVVVREPPVLGAALDATGAPAEAEQRLRAAFRG